MIGLEYIVKEFHMSFTEVGELLGVSRKSVSNWRNGWQSIPKKHLGILSEYFGVPENYFQKELNEAEKVQIQIIKIEKQERYSSNKAVLDLLDNEMVMEQLLIKIRGSIDKEDDNYNVFRNIVKLIEENDKKRIDALKMFLLCFQSDFGGNPFLNFENGDLGIDLHSDLSKHGVNVGELD